MSIAEEIPFSQFLQHSRDTLEKLEGSRERRLRLVRRDGEDLILESARRAEADEQAFSIAARILEVMLDIDESLLIEAFPSVFPWMRFLPAEEVPAFVAEFIATARASAEFGNMAPVAAVIAAWKSTAEVHADPELLRALTTPLDDADYGPVPEPSAG
ncbi:MAG TPA: hypothetical protein VJ305_14435 [Streptosporangiaceae bacterium]|jgi:hypothetical protein|nr:hypothetical protein [Streptosporangiaceae bacterium]